MLRHEVETLLAQHGWTPDRDTCSTAGYFYHRGKGDSLETLVLRYSRTGKVTSGEHCRQWRDGDPAYTETNGGVFDPAQGVWQTAYHNERLPRSKPHLRAVEIISAPNLPGARINFRPVTA